jgi:AbiU2
MGERNDDAGAWGLTRNGPHDRRDLRAQEHVRLVRKRRAPQFDEIKDAVLKETIFVTSTYALLTRVVFPIYNEPRMRRAYPLIVPLLKSVFTGDVLMALCRLFDPSRNGRGESYASLTNLLTRIGPHHAGDDVTAAVAQRRHRFQRTIPRLLEGIETHWGTLVIHRNAYLAHRDLSKVTMVEQTSLTYGDIRAAIEHAQRIVGGYRGAFEGVDPTMMLSRSSFAPSPVNFCGNISSWRSATMARRGDGIYLRGRTWWLRRLARRGLGGK